MQFREQFFKYIFLLFFLPSRVPLRKYARETSAQSKSRPSIVYTSRLACSSTREVITRYLRMFFFCFRRRCLFLRISHLNYYSYAFNGVRVSTFRGFFWMAHGYRDNWPVLIFKFKITAPYTCFSCEQLFKAWCNANWPYEIV